MSDMLGNNMFVSKSIGIDLGTSNTLIYIKGRGIVMREPSVVAIDERDRRVLAVGEAAKLMLGKTPGEISAYRPLKHGVIADFDVTANMLHQFFRRVSGTTMFSRPKAVICIPYGVTGVERRAVEDATLEAGAKSVALIEEPIAAAIGSGLNVGGARGCMVVDIGGGTTEVAVISLGGIVISNSLRIAGDEIDEAIVNYIKRKYNVLIGEGTAEHLKKTIGSIHPSTDTGTAEVRGRNLLSGLPATIRITSGELREAMHDVVADILECIRVTLEKTPPELSSDIYDNGIVLTGGVAKLAGFQLLLSQLTGIRVTMARRPLESVIIGIGKVIDSIGEYENIIEFRSR